MAKKAASAPKAAKKGAAVLSMARDFRIPYIQPLTNTPDTGYGGAT